MKQKIKPKPRSRRRGDVERKKAKVSHYMVVKPWKPHTEPVPEVDPRRVGRIATTPVPCSCNLCEKPHYNRDEAKRAARLEEWA